MATTPKTKAKKTTTKIAPKTTAQEKVTKTTKKVETKPKVSPKAKIEAYKKPTAVVESKKNVAKVVDSKVATKTETAKTATTKPNKKSLLEPGIKSVSMIALIVVVLFAVVALLWEFALPSKYKLSTVVSETKVERIFLRAEQLKADDTYDVAVIEPCNLAVRFDKTKFTANVNVTQNGNFGVYKEPFARIFENKDVDVYEFSLTEKVPQTKQQAKPAQAAVVACLDADLKKNITINNLKDITNTLSEKIPDSFKKVENDLKEIPFFNETSKKYFGKNLFQKIRLTSEQNPDIDVTNTFFAFDNRLLFVASQSSPDNIEFQVNSLQPSTPSFDSKTKIDAYKADRNALKDKINQENGVLKFDQNKNWTVNMDVANFGSLEIDLNQNDAPKSVENFIRLSYRGYYNETIFHRIVKRTDFNVIQGGDKENKNGTGGRSSFYINENSPGQVPDEIWKVAPEFSTNEAGENNPTNTPELRAPDLYKNYDNKTGLITFPKGSIAMATTGQPDSATSQFFIILSDTQLPAEYTIFGKVKESSFQILDKILKEVSPTPNEQAGPQSGQDGEPNKELKINSVKITSPSI